MVGKSLFTICAWLFYNTINYQMPSSSGYVDYLQYNYRDTTHILYFENRICIEDSAFYDPK